MKITYILLGILLISSSCEPSKKEQSNITDDIDSKKIEAVVEFPKNQKLTSEQQITAAIFAAPKQAREKAKVYGYDASGKLVTLRDGSNNFICIADNPNKDGFQVVSYHTSLEPYMSRGRTLDAEGKSRKEKEEIRSSEAESGTLKMPDNPATLHVYYGKNGFFNTTTDSIENTKYRYVVYISHATQETTGLSLSPNATGHPWLMFPGKYNAHIMISPKE